MINLRSKNSQVKANVLIAFFFLLQFTPSMAKGTGSAIDTMSCETAISYMFEAIQSLNTARFKLVSSERINDEMHISSALGIIQYSPRKLFFKSFDDHNELAYEILYVEGENNNNALISPNGFPYFNLNLNPLGSIIRNNRHLSILDAGGLYLVDMIKIGLQLFAETGTLNKRLEIMKISETETKLIINNTDYDFTTYQVQKGETIRDICYKLGVPEYKILELNKSISDYDDLYQGQVITVPTLYATKFELIIRNDDYIPTVVKIYDDKGLFARYEYLFFETNATVSQQTFSRDNPAYTF